MLWNNGKTCCWWLVSLMFKCSWEMLFFESEDTEVFKADRNRLFASNESNEKQTDHHTLKLDMLHSNMSVVCTFHCRGVFHEKYFSVRLLFFVDLCGQKTIYWCLPGSCIHHKHIFKQYSTYIKLITWCL